MPELTYGCSVRQKAPRPHLETNREAFWRRQNYRLSRQSILRADQMDALVKKRMDAIASGYKFNLEEGVVDLLDLFMQSTNDPYELGVMVFAFIIAGRK